MKNGVGFSPKSYLTKLLTILTIIGTTDAALAQNLASNQKNKDGIENTGGVKNNANSLAFKDPLAFTQQNIIKYFPDQENIQQANLLINRLGQGTIRDEVNKLLVEHIITNISDPKQQIWTIMYGLEQYVFIGDKEVKTNFSDKNDVEDTNNFKFSRKFGRSFINRLSINLEQMIKDIEQGKKDIEQGKKDIEQGKKDIEQGKKDIEQGRKEVEKGRLEIENMMRFITLDMIKSDQKTKELVLKRQQRYQRLNKIPDNPHIISLFDALK